MRASEFFTISGKGKAIFWIAGSLVLCFIFPIEEFRVWLYALASGTTPLPQSCILPKAVAFGWHFKFVLLMLPTTGYILWNYIIHVHGRSIDFQAPGAYALFIAFVFMIFIGLLLLDYIPVFYDEAYIAHYVYEHTWLELLGWYPGPFHHILHSLILKAIGNMIYDRFWLRLPSFIAASLTIMVILYPMDKQKATNHIVTLLLLFGSSMWLFYACQGRGYALQGLLLVLAVRARLSENQNVAVLLESVAIYTVPSGIVLLGLLWVMFFIVHRDNTKSLMVSISQTLAFVFLLYLPMIITGGWGFLFHTPWIQDSVSSPQVDWDSWWSLAGPLTIFCLAWGGSLVQQHRQVSLVLWLMPFVVMVLLLFVPSRVLVPLVPAWVFLVSRTIANGPKLPLALGAVAIIGMLCSVYSILQMGKKDTFFDEIHWHGAIAMRGNIKAIAITDDDLYVLLKYHLHGHSKVVADTTGIDYILINKKDSLRYPGTVFYDFNRFGILKR